MDHACSTTSRVLARKGNRRPRHEKPRPQDRRRVEPDERGFSYSGTEAIRGAPPRIVPYNHRSRSAAQALRAGRSANGQRPGCGAEGAFEIPRQARSGNDNRELPSPKQAQEFSSPIAQQGGAVPFVEQQPATGLWWGWRALLFRIWDLGCGMRNASLLRLEVQIPHSPSDVVTLHNDPDGFESRSSDATVVRFCWRQSIPSMFHAGDTHGNSVPKSAISLVSVGAQLAVQAH